MTIRVQSRTTRAGITLALGAAVISGCSVFVNGYAVVHAPNAASYTTAKNMVAAVLLAVLAALSMRGELPRTLRSLSRRQLGGLSLIGLLGGGVAFALFFEGLRHTGAAEAAFIQKSLLIWVALLAVPLLGERLGRGHVIALSLLVIGQVLTATSTVQWHAGGGDLMILAATLLWSGEVVLARVLLRSVPSCVLGVARMAVGVVFLVMFLAVSGQLASLAALGAAGWLWALITGALLCAYVAAWFAALARAGSVDVTAVLVLGAFITALLGATVRHTAVGSQAAGFALIIAGVIGVAALGWTRRSRATVVAADG